MKAEAIAPPRILLVSYPKIVFLYPTFLISLVAAMYLSVARPSLEPSGTDTILISVAFLGVWVTNLVVLAFNFFRARASSLATRGVSRVLATGRSPYLTRLRPIPRRPPRIDA